MSYVIRFFPELEDVLPTLKQISIRAGCPPGRLGDFKEAVESALIEVKNLASPSGCELVLDIIESGDSFIKASDIIFNSRSLARAIEGASRISLLLTTIGSACEESSSELETSGEHLGMFLLDAAASVMVENVIKELHRETCERMKNFRGSMRFSPGFGDFSFEYQTDIIRLLGGKETGVKVMADTFFLIPRKSVTGVVGWIPRAN